MEELTTHPFQIHHVIRDGYGLGRCEGADRESPKSRVKTLGCGVSRLQRLDGLLAQNLLFHHVIRGGYGLGRCEGADRESPKSRVKTLGCGVSRLQRLDGLLAQNLLFLHVIRDGDSLGRCEGADRESPERVAFCHAKNKCLIPQNFDAVAHVRGGNLCGISRLVHAGACLVPREELTTHPFQIHHVIRDGDSLGRDEGADRESPKSRVKTLGCGVSRLQRLDGLLAQNLLFHHVIRDGDSLGRDEGADRESPERGASCHAK
ncbi:hypothetical protein [Pontibacter sp. G13]|uniref:hypothetical protein n=1 Tax=Pontibacter sp. G13 TaxID=3074898 RepID=UPI00288A88EE|nr:hypothetical protein [Pontibacter sp. G13]WNJ20585.1 hypothetical protein RJD25_08885 [Pontibacter sp. G13]